MAPSLCGACWRQHCHAFLTHRVRVPQAELDSALKNYVGRETPLYFAGACVTNGRCTEV